MRYWTVGCRYCRCRCTAPETPKLAAAGRTGKTVVVRRRPGVTSAGTAAVPEVANSVGVAEVVVVVVVGGTEPELHLEMGVE